MPSWELFEHQDKSYRDQVLPPDVKARVAVEMASGMGWAQYAGMTGRIIGMHTFGASAPLKDLQKKFGFNSEAIVKAAHDQL
jgi:transketolase